MQQRVFLTLKPIKVVELFRLGEGSSPTLGIRTSEWLSGFYSFLWLYAPQMAVDRWRMKCCME